MNRKHGVLHIDISGGRSTIILVGVHQEETGEVEKYPDAEGNESRDQVPVNKPFCRATRLKGSTSQ